MDNRKVRDMNEAVETMFVFVFNKFIVSVGHKLAGEIIRPVEGSAVQFYEYKSCNTVDY